jgi:predicted RND superfamily exporter protein
MEAVGKVVLAIVVNYGVHYASMATHNWMCMPHTVKEVAMSMFTTGSPICSTLLTVGHQTQNGYAAGVTTGVVTLITSVLKAV